MHNHCLETAKQFFNNKKFNNSGGNTICYKMKCKQSNLNIVGFALCRDMETNRNGVLNNEVEKWNNKTMQPTV